MRRGGRAACLAIGAALATATGCDQLFDIEERPPLADAASTGADATTDAQGPDVDAASTGDAATDGADSTTVADATTDQSTQDGDAATATDSRAADGPDAEAAAPCTGPTLYVSNQGDDTRPGCDPAKPKKTIGNAIATAKVTPAVTAIEVCAGTYSEPSLTLSASVQLRGGYDCAQWMRTPTYGYPSFDPTNESLIKVPAPSASGASLVITAVTAATVVDGFTIEGQINGSIGLTAAAVLVTGGALPTLSNDHLIGGATTYTGADATPASAGIVVDNAASPTLTLDTIEGGKGSTGGGGGLGSVGVYSTGVNGAVTISGSTIRGGTGTTTGPSGSGSQGLDLSGSSIGVAYTISSSTITGGSGSNSVCANGCRATRGLYVENGSVTLVLTGNAIDGGDEVNNPGGNTTGTDCPHGVEVTAGGTATVTGNRIYGGRCKLTSPAGLASLFGLFVGGGATLVAENNMIHMGLSTIPHSAAALGTANSTGPRIVHNTLVGGPNSGSPTVASLWLENGTTGAVIENNILAGVGGAAAGVGLFLTCATDAGPPVVATFQNNLVFAQSSGVMGCNNAMTYPTMDAMTLELNTLQAGSAAGNWTTSSACGTDGHCIPSPGCLSQTACLSSFFDGWDVDAGGYANLFPTSLYAGACPAGSPPSGSGWPLLAMPPCAVAKSALNDSNTVKTDLFGSCRSDAGPSMGAVEYVGSCR